MLDAETMQLGLVGLAAISAAALIYFLAYPLLSGESQAEKRIQGVTENKAKRAVRTAQAEQVSNRRRQVADTLKELEQKQKQREKLTMRMRLERAGLDLTPRTFWLISLVAGIVIGAVTYVSLPGMNPLISVAAAFVGAAQLAGLRVRPEVREHVDVRGEVPAGDVGRVAARVVEAVGQDAHGDPAAIGAEAAGGHVGAQGLDRLIIGRAGREHECDGGETAQQDGKRRSQPHRGAPGSVPGMFA